MLLKVYALISFLYFRFYFRCKIVCWTATLSTRLRSLIIHEYEGSKIWDFFHLFIHFLGPFWGNFKSVVSSRYLKLLLLSFIYLLILKAILFRPSNFIILLFYIFYVDIYVALNSGPVKAFWFNFNYKCLNL